MYRLIFILLITSLVTPIFADNFSDSNKIMNWAEETYPEYFPKEQLTEAWNTVGYKGDQYIARHYASTNSYIGTTNGTVFTYNAAKWGSELGEMGTMEAILAQVTSSAIIVGTWFKNRSNGGITYYTFTENGNIIEVNANKDNNGLEDYNVWTGTYQINGSTVTLSIIRFGDGDSETSTLSYEVSGDSLTFSNSTNSESYSRLK